MLLNDSKRKIFDNPVRRFFVKLFKATNNSTIANCQYYMNSLPMSDIVVVRTVNFLKGLLALSCTALNILSSLKNIDERSVNYSYQCKHLKADLWQNFVVVNNIRP